jgi:hypothetical protein
MPTKIKLRRDTASNWISEDPTLASGEMGLETDTLRIKIGDGSTPWAEMEYATVTPGDLTEATTLTEIDGGNA